MKLTILALALLLPLHTSATMLLAPPPGSSTTVFAFPGQGYLNLQPLVFGQFTITGTGLVYGEGQNLIENNGVWSPTSGPAFAWVGVNDAYNTQVVVDLGGLYSSVGAFMNYAGRSSYPYAPYIQALNESMQILETYYLVTDAPISTPSGVNEGAFRGVERATADIRYFVIGNGYLTMHSLTLAGGADPGDPAPGDPPTGTPEPATFALGFVSLAVAHVAARRRRHQ
jgi:hypothetical protein